MKRRATWSTVSALWDKITRTARGGLLFCLLSGAVLSLPYRIEGLFALVYPALLLFCLLLRTEALQKKPFRACFCFLLGMYVPLYSWFAALYPLSALDIPKQSALGIVLLGCIAVPLIQAAVQAAVLQAVRLFRTESPWLHAFLFACLWLLSEALLSVSSLALPWGTLSLAQTGFSPLLSVSSLFGSSFLPFFSVFLCDLLAGILQQKQYKRLLSAAGIPVAVCLLGLLFPLLPFSPSPTGETLSVAAVQGNISTDEKWEGDMQQAVFDTYYDLTKQAASNGAKLILLPESAIPAYFRKDGSLQRAFSAIAQENGCTIVLGVLRKESDGVHNSLVAVLPDGSCSNFYDKQHPVPFGEVMPLEGILNRLFPALGDLNLNAKLVTGKTEPLLQLDGLTAGCYLCFDSAFQGSKQANGDLLLLATNDAWFGASAAVTQHLRFAKLRAAECGRSLLRAGNTGISALVDASGKLLSQTQLQTKDILYGELSLYDGKTLYACTGDLLTPLALVTLLLYLLRDAFQRKKQKRIAAS